MASRRFGLVISLFTLVAVISGCSQQGSNPYESHPSVRAEALIGDSIGATSAANRAPAIYINRQALDKEFLLQGSVAVQGIASTGNSIKSRVVSFSLYDDKVYMVESTQGHVVTNDLPTSLVLASFPILKEDGKRIYFDFNTGMTNLFASGEWYASDIDGKKYSPSFTSLKTKNSRILSVNATNNNQFVIRQAAQLALSGGFSAGEDNRNIEVRYYLSPYRPDPSFTPVVGGKFKRTGYFEIPPQLLSNGVSQVLASRWNPKKPIVFAISANTPPEFKQAVKDGILYWNRAFGREVVKAVDAPAGVTAPDINYNVVQWVPYDTAGSAYADAQADPRTGEIQHAQVYLTSAFGFLGKQRARALLKALKDTKPSKKMMIGLHGLHQHALCDYDAREALINSIESVINTATSDAEVLRASQDYVRTTAAHEIGHTLGLRHNYAGSLATKNYPLANRPQIFKEYLVQDHVGDNVITSSSVMDYLAFEEDVIAGYVIRKPELPALEYDAKAIAGLYDGKTYQHGEIPLFCTDSDLERFADCKQFDSGTSLVEMAAATTPQRLDRLAYDFLETYIAAKTPMLGNDVVPVEEVGFEPEAVAQRLLSPRELMLTAAKDARFLKVFRSFPYVGPGNLDQVKEKEREELSADLKLYGGMEKVLEVISAQQAQQISDRFAAIIDDPLMQSGIGGNGQQYSFSKEEIVVMKSTIAALTKKLPAELAKEDLGSLKEVPPEWKITNTEIGDNLAATVVSRVKEYVFTRTGEKNSVEIEFPVQPDQEKAEAERAKATGGMADSNPEEKEKPKLRRHKVTLPKFFYTLESRKKAAELLAPGKEDESIDWGLRESAEQKKALAQLLNESIECGEGKGCLYEKIKPEDVKLVAIAGIPEVEKKRLEKEVTRWFMENKSVLEAFK